MKKITLLLFVAFANSAWAQSFQFLEHGTSTVAQANYTRNVDATIGDEFKLDIKNISSSMKTYKIRKTIVNTPSGCATPNDIKFCDAQNCYSNTQNISAHNLQINAGQIINDSAARYGLSAHIDQGDCCGTYLVRYKVYDVTNANDSVSVNITYIVTNCTNGIKNPFKNFELSAASPNPASGAAVLKYEFPTAPGNALVKIYNTIGSMVKEVKLEGQEGKAVIDVTDLSDGIYFYSLHVNDKIISTKKLIVAH